MVMEHRCNTVGADPRKQRHEITISITKFVFFNVFFLQTLAAIW